MVSRTVKDGDKLIKIEIDFTSNGDGAVRVTVRGPDGETLEREISDEADQLKLAQDAGDRWGDGACAKVYSELTKRMGETAAPSAEPEPEAADEETDEQIPYEATPDGILWFKGSGDGEVPVSLCNFAARILQDVAYDDGAEVRRVFRIEVRKRDRVAEIEVPAVQFTGMNWPVEALGAEAVIRPGQGKKDHLRCAVQLLSGRIPRKTIYQHLGWRRIDGEDIYLHASGAIGPHGPVEGIEVSPGGELERFELPTAPVEHSLIAAIRASLRLLEIAPDEITIPVYCAIWRAVLVASDFGVHLVGPTGTGKTVYAALAQQHFGASMDTRHLPGSWSSTGNALEAQAFAAKDALLVVDDFAPGGTQSDIQRLHREAARLIRAQGNRSGRGRMRADCTLRPTKPPRGLVLSTGEDIPLGQSVRARLLVVELEPKSMDWALITEAQAEAADGVYARAMAGYLSWLARRYPELRAGLVEEVRELRAKAATAGGHRRTPEIIAHLYLGLRRFLEFATEVVAISGAEAEALRDRAWSALGRTAEAQASHQRAADPVTRFLELLAGAIASGQAHLADQGGTEPMAPLGWGWRQRTIGTGQHEREEWQPQGSRVGWIDGDDVSLDPPAAYRAAQGMAAGGEGIVVAPQTLWKRLHQRGLLARIDDDGTGRYTCRQHLEGRRRRVVVISADSLSECVGRVGRLGPEAPDGSAKADSWPTQRPTRAEADARVGQQCGPPDGQEGRSGPDGPHGPHAEGERPPGLAPDEVVI